MDEQTKDFLVSIVIAVMIAALLMALIFGCEAYYHQ